MLQCDGCVKLQALPHGAVKKSKSSQQSAPNQGTANQALLACQTVVILKRNIRLLMFVESITMPQKKKRDKRAATEITQEIPHTHKQLPVATATQEDKGRQQTGSVHQGWQPQLCTRIWSRCLRTRDLGAFSSITDLLKGHSHRICKSNANKKC